MLMDVTMLLCDFAEAHDGKLYVMGGGWSTYNGSDPIDLALAIRIGVPWDRTNQKHTMLIKLVDQDGSPMIGHLGTPIEAGGQIEFGRPPGAIPGNEIVTTFAVTFKAMPLEANHYKIAFMLDDTEVESISFNVNRPPDWKAPSNEE